MQNAPVLHTGMYFRYGKKKRENVTAASTFDAICRGERCSTTRFASSPSTARWRVVEPGDMVRFYENADLSGKYVDVIIDSIKSINLMTCSSEELEAWSVAEGWLPEIGRELAKKKGAEALWIRFVCPEAQPPAQMALF